MNGEVDSSGRALLALDVRSSDNAEPVKVTAWVDTAFTGELVIPLDTIRSLGLQQSAAVKAGLADGTEVVLETYSCLIDWFGDSHQVEVIANDGQCPLLGVGLLHDRRLTVDYRTRKLSLE